MAGSAGGGSVADGSDETTTEPAAARGQPDGLLRSEDEARDLLIELVGRHADELLRIARRHTLCQDDAFDAYQRTLEIGLRHARRLDRATADRWLMVVCRREAQALRRDRRSDVSFDDVDFDRFVAHDTLSPEERAIAGETVDRSAEALRRLKRDELRALGLKASGLSYAEIAEVTGFSRTNQFRVVVREEDSYPFRTGASRVVSVRVR